MVNPDDMIDQAIDQAKYDEVLSDFDIGYIKECILDQIDNLLSTSSKKNYLKKIEEKIQTEEISPDYLNAVCANLYSEIVDMISEKFGFTIDKTEDRIENLAKTLYKFFVLQYTENIVLFIESEIIENQKTIVAELQDRKDINTRHIEGVSSKVSLILNNIGDVIEIIDGLNPDFTDFIDYIDKHENAKSSVVKIKDYNDRILGDTDEIVPMIMKSLLNEDEGFSDIYTELQRNIYNRFAS